MNDDTRAVYLILNNHLRDVHHALQEQMLAKHRWTFVETPQGKMSTDLMPLYSIILLLERLATPDQPMFPPTSDFGAELPNG